MPRSSLLALLGAAASLVAAAPAAAAPPGGQTLLLDRPAGFGPLPFDGAGRASITTQPLSADGRWLVFSSSADSLLACDDDSGVHVYRLDRTSGAIGQVDAAADGAQLGVALRADQAQVSADGDRVAFTLRAPAGSLTTLPQGVYVKDLASGALTLVSRATGFDGAPASVGAASLSGDGRSVAFTATAPLHTDAGDGGFDDVYVRGVDSGVTTRVDVRSGSTIGTVATGRPPAIDFDGDVVAWIADVGAGPDERPDDRDDAYLSIGGVGAQKLSASGASSVALAGDGDTVAWTDSSKVWAASSALAVRADVPRPGGSDGFATALAFEPVASATARATRLDFVSFGRLDPERDVNSSGDLYSAETAHLGDAAHVHLLTSGAADGAVAPGAAAADGGVVVFAAAAPDLPAGDPVDAQVYERLPAGAAPPEARDVVRSLPPNPAPRADAAGDAALRPLHAVSDDGGRVVFATLAPAFGARARVDAIFGSTRLPQVLLRDAVSGETTLVSSALGGGPADAASHAPTIDGAGRRVAFLSAAHDLVSDSPPRGSTVHAYVRDLDSGATTLVDRTADGRPLPSGVEDAVLSGDGRHLAYATSDAAAPEAPGDGIQHVFVVDLDRGVTTLADRAPGSGLRGDGTAEAPDLSRDGSRVAFLSDARNLGAGSTRATHVFVRDLVGGSTTWASVPEDGDPGHGDASELSLSGDGEHVAFAQRDSSFGWGMPFGRATTQIFVRDLAAATTTLLSAAGGGDGAFADEAVSPSLDRDGSHLAFVAASGDPGRFSGHQVHLRDRRARTTTLLSLAAAGGPSRDGARYASVSGDGRCAAFDSGSGDLGGGYGPDRVHVHLRCVGDPPTAGGGGGGGRRAGVVEPSPRRDRTAPRITRARLSRTSFAGVRSAKGRGRAVASRTRRRDVPRGTRIAFTLSEAARVTVAVERSLPGRVRGRACVAPRRGLKRRCTRTVTVATPIVRQLRAGARALAFSGRYGRGGRSALRPGAYRLRLVARDGAGNSSRPVRLAFEILRDPAG